MKHLFYNFSTLSHFLIACNSNVMKYLTYKKNVYKKKIDIILKKEVQYG